MARAGGEVDGAVLEDRIRNAKHLIFLFQGSCLVGITALKNPLVSYRRSVSAKAGVKLDTSEFPYELGYVFVLPSARDARLSRPLVEAALKASNGAGVFATSRNDNVAMHRTLVRFGFAAVGHSYRSDRGNHELQLFIRAVAQQGNQPNVQKPHVS